MNQKRRMIVLAEGRFSPLRSKTANGAIVYLRDQVLAIIDSTKAGQTAQVVLGYGGDIPVVKSLEEGPMIVRRKHRRERDALDSVREIVTEALS